MKLVKHPFLIIVEPSGWNSCSDIQIKLVYFNDDAIHCKTHSKTSSSFCMEKKANAIYCPKAPKQAHSTNISIQAGLNWEIIANFKGDNFISLPYHLFQFLVLPWHRKKGGKLQLAAFLKDVLCLNASSKELKFM